MEVLHHLLYGFTIALQPINIFYCFVGTLMGTLVGVLPGIGPSGTLAILLPATFHLNPVSAIIMLAGICYGCQYGGSTTSIMLNIPGEPSSVVTALDGYAMARKGRAGPALGISAFGSFIAGTVSVVGLVFFAPPLARFALKFGPPDYFSLMVMAMMMVTYLSKTSMRKTLIMGIFGIMVGLVGMDTISGKTRYTFGIADFYDGIGFVPIIMGLYGIAEVLDNVGVLIKQDVFSGKITGLFPNKEDWKRSAMPITRGTLLGFFMGLIPGTGIIPSFVAYAIEKRISKHPERFGTGEIEGVASPESCNNAAISGNFVPLMSMGIPTNAMTTILLAALMIYGLQPGPFFIKNSPDLFWGVVASMYIGNVMLLVLNLPLIPLWVQVLKIPYSYLFTFILLFVFIGAYSLSYSVMDIYISIAFGVVGYFMRKFDYEGAPFVLGLVLGPMMEIALRRSLILSHGSFMIFVQRPISAAFLLILVLIAVLSFIKKRPVVMVAGQDKEYPERRAGMKKIDFWSGTFWCVLSVFICISSLKLGLGSLHNPGPGFIFFWGGIILGILSISVLISALGSIMGAAAESTEKAFGNVDWMKVISILITITTYTILFERLGYLLSTFLLIAFLLYSIGAKKWYAALLIATASSFLTYAFFALCLHTRLPKGLLGI